MTPDRLKDPLLSAEWEYAFTEIEAGKRSAANFNKEIDDYIKDLVKNYKPVSGLSTPNSQIQSLNISCPHCKGEMSIGKFGLYCKDKCGFIISKFRGKALSQKEQIKLLQGEEVKINGLKSSAGKRYSLLIKPNGNISNFSYNGKTYYSLDFDTKFPARSK